MRHSAILLVVTELLDTVPDGIAHTEATKEPVVRMATIMVDCAAIATVVIAILPSRSGCPLGEVLLGRLG